MCDGRVDRDRGNNHSRDRGKNLYATIRAISFPVTNSLSEPMSTENCNELFHRLWGVKNCPFKLHVQSRGATDAERCAAGSQQAGPLEPRACFCNLQTMVIRITDKRITVRQLGRPHRALVYEGGMDTRSSSSSYSSTAPPGMTPSLSLTCSVGRSTVPASPNPDEGGTCYVGNAQGRPSITRVPLVACQTASSIALEQDSISQHFPASKS
jgi:hypothetical protein